MSEKLRSHLRKTRGFTLVELLIVIAIIAILVLIVIVALNPIERIRDTNDQRANSDVKSTVAAVMACSTKELAQSPVANVVALCGTWAALVAGNYVSGTEPTGLTWVTAGTTVCLFKLGGHGAPDNAGGDSARSQIVEVGDGGSTIGAATPCPVP